MPDAETHRLGKRLARARRNEGRRMRRANPIVVNWTAPRAKRCVVCGRYLAVGAEAGHGLGFRMCEPCWLAVDLKRDAFRLLALARPAVLSGAA